MTSTSSQKICVVVQSDSEDSLMNKLKHIPLSAGFVEIRYDYLKNHKPSILKSIRKAVKQKVIFTCRLERFGGKCSNGVDFWEEVVREADAAKFDYIDIDYDLTKEIDYRSLKNGFSHSSIILSYHNFNHTPPYLKLKKILKIMDGLDPEICKFATKVKGEKDVETLFRLLLSKKQKTKLVCLGMGRPGIKTRILSPLLGSELTFASLGDGQETADGQLSFGELKDRVEKINSILGS